MRVSIFTGESWQAELSFDAALASDPPEPSHGSREWLDSRTADELAALSEEIRARLAEWFFFSLPAIPLEGEILFPDIDLPEPNFDNGEPEGHLQVFWSGMLPREGGAFAIALAEGAPAAIITTVVDGTPLRRPAVLLGGERKVLTEVAAVEEPEAQESGEVGHVMPGRDADPGPAAIEEDPVDTTAVAEAYLRLGWGHCFPRGFDHLLLALAMFFGARTWRGAFGQPLVFALGAALGTLVREAGSPPDLLAVGAIALSVEGAVVGNVRWWRLALVGFLGCSHGMAFSGAETGAVAPLAFNLGVDAAQLATVFMAFVAVGWGHEAGWWRRAIAVPGTVLVGLASVATLFAG